ncbi:MAG: DNA/RNA helicase domain-containing protein [Alloprevotella sp.]|nr:DNA/RNA helicase domain-containing protein [Alloprevotella sp.]
MTNRCLYHAAFKEFLNSGTLEVLGTLHDHFHGEAQTTTGEAWKREIQLLQQVLTPWTDEAGEIIFEYDIPRLGKRIDVVLLLRGIIFCLEFKVGQKNALQADVEQVMDYALDLKNFHRFSHDRIIVPILIPTDYKRSTTDFIPSVYDDAVYNPLITGAEGLQSMLTKVLHHAHATASVTIDNWIISPYTPTPTIIEAARTLYENHSVEDITRHEADEVSTDATINYLLQIIDRSKRSGQKSICFVTGVPGAGKTLVGLDVAIKQTYKEDNCSKEDGAVFLSGNGPLVAVLTEALARDNCKKNTEKGKRLSDSRREVSEFIQIIHRYRDNMLAKIKNPVENGIVEIDPQKAVKLESAGYGEVEHVAIFDEAQRSWTHKRIADYLKRGGTYGNKLKVPNFPFSEAEFLIWSLDRREDWAVIICLVGGGQEINTGEAGITAWIEALNHRFKHWHVYISNQLTEPEYAEGKVNELLRENGKVTFSDSLHLAVSLRSFRAEKLSAFVHALLSFSADAGSLYREVAAKGYPIVLTRDMDKARSWLRSKARGSQQTGVLVSKVAARFKPLAVNILAQGDENAVHWFLEDKTDVRSSNYLEDAATEIQVQGLELDFVCVLWDADMRYNDGHWEFFKFNGKNKWTPVANTPNGQEEKKYMLNAYRVLLTRARQGIVICVPKGNSSLTPEGFPEDPTRLPAFYNGTYAYLKSLGIEEI